MSQSDYDISEYKTTSGVDSKMADVSNDSHALKEAFGSGSENKKFRFEAEVMAERIADWYDDPAAGLREYLSNAETACIRRAQMELRNNGFDVPESTDKALEVASKKCDYQPVVEVTYNRKPESTRLVIEDNGCGITIEEYEILRNIGYSASHDSGDRLGQFGMGVMSFLNIVGVEGMMGMSTRSFPSTDREETAYSLAMYATNMEYLDGLRDSYGTRFKFPAFCSKAQDIPIRQKVEEFANGMRVTVLYREKDTDGKEVFNEDYTPEPLSSRYPDDALVITYENEFFEAVMSPQSPETREYVTYNISMPIRRNTSKYGSEPKFEAPWTWDFRGKAENGPIVECSDESVVGLAPVSESKYESLPDERKEDFIRRSEVPDDATVMPVPASSRDSYEGGYDDFWRFVSRQLNQKWRDLTKERFEQLDDFDQFNDFSSRKKHLLVRGYQQFGPGYGENDPSTVVDHFEKKFDITLDEDVAAKIDKLTNSHRVVNRGTDTPHHKSSTSKEHTWQIIDEASDGGTVYMAKTISAKKAEIAWELHDNNVIVRLDEAEYEEYEELWGWSKLKELPTRNLKEKLPDLPDDVAEKYEKKSDDDYKKSGGGNHRTSNDPRTKRIKVYGSSRRSRGSRTTHAAEDVFDAMDSGDTISAGHIDAEKIIAFDTNEHNVGDGKRHIKRGAGVAITVVPRYVYNYLTDADNVYESVEEIKQEEEANATIELSGDREVMIDDIPDDELILTKAENVERRFKNNKDALREWFENVLDTQFSSVTFIDYKELDQYHWVSPSGGTIIRLRGYSGIGRRPRVDGNRLEEDTVISEVLTPDNIDWDHDFMQEINKRGTLKGKGDRVMDVVEYLQKHDALPTTDGS